MLVSTIQEELSPIIRRTVETARASGGVLRVNDAASAIVREQGYDPMMLRMVIDALSRQCIRSGVVVEFQSTPPDDRTA